MIQVRDHNQVGAVSGSDSNEVPIFALHLPGRLTALVSGAELQRQAGAEQSSTAGTTLGSSGGHCMSSEGPTPPGDETASQSAIGLGVQVGLEEAHYLKTAPPELVEEALGPWAPLGDVQEEHARVLLPVTPT